MKKIFSYSLFEPKVMPQHRFWDKDKDKKDRYWYNIPTILLLNKILYPDYESIFHITPNLTENKLYDVFSYFENVHCEVIEREYQLTEPAIWRMMPIWDRFVDIVHVRDTDSLPMLEEYKYIKFFENSTCTVGTIRSHEYHYNNSCRILAGLCSFKPNLIPVNIKGFNFDFYYSQRNNEYGSDQNLLIKTFASKKEFTSTNFLDCKIQRQKNSQDFPCVEADLSIVNVEQNIIDLFNNLITLSNTNWLGESCDSRGEFLNKLLSKEQDIRNKICSNQYLKQFFKVE